MIRILSRVLQLFTGTIERYIDYLVLSSSNKIFMPIRIITRKQYQIPSNAIFMPITSREREKLQQKVQWIFAYTDIYSFRHVRVIELPRL